MEMTCGLGLGILLICLVQAECADCSWVKDAPKSQNSNTHAGFPQPNGRQRKFSNNLQNQLKQGLFSPCSIQASSLNTNPAVNNGYERKLPTRSFTQTRSQLVQSSGRLVKNNFVSKPKRQSTLPAQQGTRRGQRERYSFRPASYPSAAQEPSSYERKGSSATLFGPVAPGPRSFVRMQTYAQTRARKVPSHRSSGGAKVRSFLPQTAAGRSYPSPWFALNVGGFRPRSQLTSLDAPRSSRVGESASGFAPVMIHEIPEPFGGSAIRRLKQTTEQETVPVQKPQQVYTPPQRIPPYKPDRPSSQPGSDWSRTKPVQKPHWISTPPPQRVLAYNPDLPRVHPASRWSKVKLPYRL